MVVSDTAAGAHDVQESRIPQVVHVFVGEGGGGRTACVWLVLSPESEGLPFPSESNTIRHADNQLHVWWCCVGREGKNLLLGALNFTRNEKTVLLEDRRDARRNLYSSAAKAYTLEFVGGKRERLTAWTG